MLRFRIDPSSGVPIYLQIVRQVKTAVALGRLCAEDPLPSVRQLAVDLAVNHNTIARAYLDLEHEGVIYKRAGQGSFVARRSLNASLQESRNRLCALLENTVAEAARLGLDDAEVRACMEQVMTIRHTSDNSSENSENTVVDRDRPSPIRKD